MAARDVVLPLALSRIGQDPSRRAEWQELPVGAGLPFGLVMVLLLSRCPLGLWLITGPGFRGC